MGYLRLQLLELLGTLDALLHVCLTVILQIEELVVLFE